MASTAACIMSLKVLFISTGVLSLALGLKISVPLVLDFSVSQASVIWSSVASWLRPPFPYVRMDSTKIPMEIPLTAEKPLVATRFGHRKLVNKASPEGGRALRMAKPRRYETMESTRKMITEKKAMPLSRHLKKSETFKETLENQVNVDPLAEPSLVMKKSETFKDGPIPCCHRRKGAPPRLQY